MVVVVVVVVAVEVVVLVVGTGRGGYAVVIMLGGALERGMDTAMELKASTGARMAAVARRRESDFIMVGIVGVLL